MWCDDYCVSRKWVEQTFHACNSDLLFSNDFIACGKVLTGFVSGPDFSDLSGEIPQSGRPRTAKSCRKTSLKPMALAPAIRGFPARAVFLVARDEVDVSVLEQSAFRGRNLQRSIRITKDRSRPSMGAKWIGLLLPRQPIVRVVA